MEQKIEMKAIVLFLLLIYYVTKQSYNTRQDDEDRFKNYNYLQADSLLSWTEGNVLAPSFMYLHVSGTQL